MRRVALLLAVVSALGCAAPSREGLLSEPRRRGSPACSWSGARWGDRGTLLIRGTAVPLGRVRSQWREGAWAGALFSGSLRSVSQDVAVLEGEWRGRGAAFAADVDASTDAALGAWKPLRVGEAGVVLKGGALRVLDAAGEGRVLVAPPSMALRHFAPPLPPVLDLDCGAVTIAAARPPGGDPRRALLAAAGFPSDAPALQLDPRSSLDASSVPGGPSVGRFVTGDVPALGFGVETRGQAVRFVLPEPGGVVWVGWVPADALVAAPEAEFAFAQAAPPRSATREGEWRRCDEALTLSASVAGLTRAVGRLEPGTPFIAREGGEALVEVELDLDWFTPAPHVALSLPAQARRCERVPQAAP